MPRARTPPFRRNVGWPGLVGLGGRQRRHLSSSAWRRRLALCVSAGHHRRVQRDCRRDDGDAEAGRRRRARHRARSHVGLVGQGHDRWHGHTADRRSPQSLSRSPTGPTGCACRCRPFEGRRRSVVHGRVHGRPRRGPAPHRQHPRRARGLQRELAQSRAPMAADDRSSVRQGDRRVHRHRARAVPGGGQRPAGRGAGPAGRASAHALEAVGADCLVAVRAGGRALLGASRRRRQGRRAADVGVSTGPRHEPVDLRGPVAPRDDVLRRADRPVSLREARQRAGRRHERRHRARQRDLLRREGRRRRARAGGPRDRAPVVGQCGHRARLGRRVAERGLCDVLHAALHRARRGTRRVRARPDAQPRRRCSSSSRSCRTRR